MASYRLAETQPSGFQDGKDTPGTPFNLTQLDGEAVDDIFTAIGLTAGVDGHDFNFGELAIPFSKRPFLASSR